MSSASNPVLAFEGIGHAYGRRAVVHGLDLDIGAGEVLCLLGPSGCGKSTVLRLAAGLEPLRQGRIRIAGREVAGPDVDVPPEKRQVGLVFQDHALFPHLDVLANVAFGLGGADRKARAQAWLERVGLGGRGADWPDQLSGGEQQRVALARALAPAPRVMLMDEPFSSLDTGLRASLRREALGLLRDAGTATLLVTHDPEEAMAMADRLAVMRDGELVQVGTPDAVWRYPVDRFVAAFLGEVNDVPAALANGSGANCLCRPESVRLGIGSGLNLDIAGHGHVMAKVQAARRIGGDIVVDLALDDGARLSARSHGSVVPEAGTRLAVSIDPADLIVLPPA